MYPKAAPPWRVVRGEEPKDLFRAVKGAFHELVSFSCTSGKNGTGGGCWEPARPPLRNHSSNLEGSARGGGFHTSPTFSEARESIAVISGSGSDNATTPEGGNAAVSSSPEREREHSDAAIDIWSSGGAPKERCGVPHSAEAPVRSNGTPTGCGVLEGWGTPLEEALTVILKSGCQDERQIAAEAEGTHHFWHSWRLLRNSEMVMSPQEEHEPSTKASSVCWMPRHVRQRSWPSWGAETDRTQKRTGDKTSLKRRDHPCYSFREFTFFSAEARRGAGHRTLLVWLSSRELLFSPVRLRPPLLRCNAHTHSLFLTRRIWEQ